MAFLVDTDERVVADEDFDGSRRLRTIGQGYDDGLAELAVRYGVRVDGG